MVLGDKVIAASDPKEEEKQALETEEDGEEDEDEKESPDDNCFCICFCEPLSKENEGENEHKNDGKDEKKEVAGQEEEEEDAELVDPQDELRECCAQKKDCATLKERLEECNARVESRSKTAETCVEEIIDFMHCVDHCVAKSLFSKLK